MESAAGNGKVSASGAIENNSGHLFAGATGARRLYGLRGTRKHENRGEHALTKMKRNVLKEPMVASVLGYINVFFLKMECQLLSTHSKNPVRIFLGSSCQSQGSKC